MSHTRTLVRATLARGHASCILARVFVEMPAYMYPAPAIGRVEPDVYMEALKEATSQLQTASDPVLRELLVQRRITPPEPWRRLLAIQALAHCFADATETHMSKTCCAVS